MRKRTKAYFENQAIADAGLCLICEKNPAMSKESIQCEDCFRKNQARVKNLGKIVEFDEDMKNPNIEVVAQLN